MGPANRRTVTGKLTPYATPAFKGGQPGYDEAGNVISAQPAPADVVIPYRRLSSSSTSEDVKRKTEKRSVKVGTKEDPVVKENDYGIPVYKFTGDANPLHGFRTFNYLFTLAAVKESGLTNPNSIRASAVDFVVAKSAGKGATPITTNKLSKASGLVDEFNKRGPGRFDMYLNNIEIETLMAFSKTTNLAMATKISFEVHEPLSVNGFLEAIQVASIAAGHKSYMGAPFVLKVEFIGYPDTETGPSTTLQKADPGDRYFVLNITKVEIDVTEAGTKYRVQAIAHNETGYGDSNDLKTPIQISGTTVGTILKNLMTSLEQSEKAATEKETGRTATADYDRYEIVFPSMEGDKLNYSKPNTALRDSAVTELLNSGGLYSMPDPGPVLSEMYSSGKKPKFTFNPALNVKGQPKFEISKTSMQFTKGAKIHDIISSIVRDSTWGKRIFAEPPEKIIKNGMVEFVHVAIELEYVNGQWNPHTKRPVCLYRYVVIPYKMHFTRIPLFQKLIPKTEMQLFVDKHVKRKYSYLYTGKNVDIIKFNITLNHLFYQSYTQNLGNKTIFSNPELTKRRNSTNKSLNYTTPEAEENKFIPDSPRRSDSKLSNIVKHGSNAGPRDYYSYDVLVSGMHQAILDNTDMIRCEVEILGDPYYLVTGGIGNYRPTLIDSGITTDGEAPYQTHDVVIVLEFKNPSDINSKTGEAIFDDTKVPFSGCFRVIKAHNKFMDGLFTQRLSLVRIPGQPYDSSKPPDPKSPATRVGLVDVDAPAVPFNVLTKE